MPGGVAVGALAVGAVLGYLMPPVVYRLSVGFDEPARSTCHHCGHSLPVVMSSHSYVRGPAVSRMALRARCPDCDVRWGPPAWATATVAGGASGILAAVIGLSPELPLYVALAIVGTALGAIDLACHRLPTTIIGPSIVVGAVGLLGVAAFTGQWSALGRALLGAAALGLLFEVLYRLPGQGIGYGDVRLAVLLGLFLGWLGWAAVGWGAVLPWLLNGPVVLVLLLTGRVDRRSRLPLGPAMLAGALLAVVVSHVRI